MTVASQYLAHALPQYRTSPSARVAPYSETVPRAPRRAGRCADRAVAFPAGHHQAVFSQPELAFAVVR
eukprot:1949575-Rhodomonas_salina.3